MNKRWDVEVKPDVFHDVGAATLEVQYGCLVFRDIPGDILVAYAAGQWITVSAVEQ